MISKNKKKNFYSGPIYKKIFKHVSNIVMPILVLVAIVFGLLSFFEPAQVTIHQIVFYDNDGETVLDIQYVKTGKSFALPETPSDKDGHEFSEWINESMEFATDIETADSRIVLGSGSFVARYDGLESNLDYSSRVFEETEDGSNSHNVILTVFLVSVLLIVALLLVDARLKKDHGYVIYGHYVKKKVPMTSILTLLTLTAVTLVPFYILVITSLKTTVEANSVGFTWWPKQGFTLAHYIEIFEDADKLGISLLRSFLNSLVYAIVPNTIGVFVSAFAAYAFAKLKFKSKNTLYKLLLFTMMIPGCITMASSYALYDMIGWTDPQLWFSPVLLIPGCFGTVSCVIFLKEYFVGVPDALLESAKIDGCGSFRAFFKVMLPLGMPAMVAQFVLGFIGSYNNYTNALIYLRYPEQYTVQLAISFFNDFGADRALLSAAAVIAMLPILLLYIIFQKQIINGISLSSGLKG